ncbi:MAG: hypothetical protein K0U64_08190 [Actinomycetia bacterium]|nr:hypothetical protein [Actinomycetes bacterium]
MSILDQSFEVNSPSVISDEVGGEVLAIHLDSGTYYVFPPQTLPVWAALGEGVPGRLLLKSRDNCNDTDRDRESALTAYLAKLLELQLLRPSQTVRIPETSPVWEAADLAVHQYTDLADLLGPDPIHDADEELGWPNIKGSGA